MTNYEKWRLYMRDYESPDAFIDFGFYFLIGSCLQRRVWVNEKPLYPNPYVVFVANAGVGKGMVIGEVTEFLRHHKIDKRGLAKQQTDAAASATNGANNAIKDEAKKNPNTVTVDPEIIKLLVSLDNPNEPTKSHEKKKLEEPKLLFPVGADTTTFQSLTQEMAASIRRINYWKFNEATQKNEVYQYAHSSIIFTLEELASLFKKNMEDIVHFLQQTYDCKPSYDYKTKHQGEDHIKNPCSSLLAGATPDFMQDCFKSSLINQGFSSRAIFVVGYTNRFRKTFIDNRTPDQLKCREDILEHLKKLSTLYGRVEWTQEAAKFIIDWYEIRSINDVRPNRSLKLDPYYQRKKAHLQKMATIVHFMESTEMVIDKPAVVKALQILNEVEKHMHFALSYDNKNPLATTARKIERFLEQGPADFDEISFEFYSEVKPEECKDILNYLMSVGRVASFPAPKNKKGETPTMYHLKKKDSATGSTGEGI